MKFLYGAKKCSAIGTFCATFSLTMFPMRNIIGRRLRQARLSQKPKLTQQQLAARLQILGMTVDRAGVSKIENGIRTVTDVEILMLSKALNVSPAWLLDVHDSR
jgi:transcriptional regulator with XRE-family HTH domain